LGGANWSGASFDPTTGTFYVNSNNVPNIITLAKGKNGKTWRYGPYNHKGYIEFRDHEGYPGIKPPWGQLTAINLNTGDFAWRVTLGEYAELTARGIPQTGTESIGGTIVTAGGLVFIAATKDERLHAFDKQSGKLLWEHPLPAGGYATPSTYMVNGRQYVVIAAGGAGKMGTKAGDAFVAFALP
jgi:quinoprotein glucose dehydrogenase